MSPSLAGVPAPSVSVVTLSSVGAAAGGLTGGTDAVGPLAGTRLTSVAPLSDGFVVATEPPEDAAPLSSPPQASNVVPSTAARRTGARGERRRRNIVVGS